MRTPLNLLQILVLVAGLCPGTAAAQAFSVPSKCGSRAEFDARLRELLAREDVPAPDALAIIKTGAGYTLSMGFDGLTRELRDLDCQLLLRTAALMLAAHTDPQLATPAAPDVAASEPDDGEAAAESPSPSAASQPRTTTSETRTAPAESNPATEPDADPPPKPPVPRAQSLSSRKADASATDTSDEAGPRAAGPAASLWLGLAAGASGQEVPRLSPRVELGAGFERANLSLLLAFHYTLPQRRDRGDGFAVNVQAFGMRALAGYAVLPYLRLRLGPTAAYMTGEGTGGTPSKAGGGALALGLSAEVAPHLCASPAICGELSLFGRYALLRPTFEVAGFGQVFRAPSWSGGAVLRLLVKIL